MLVLFKQKYFSWDIRCHPKVLKTMSIYFSEPVHLSSYWETFLKAWKLKLTILEYLRITATFNCHNYHDLCQNAFDLCQKCLCRNVFDLCQNDWIFTNRIPLVPRSFDLGLEFDFTKKSIFSKICRPVPNEFDLCQMDLIFTNRIRNVKSMKDSKDSMNWHLNLPRWSTDRYKSIYS